MSASLSEERTAITIPVPTSSAKEGTAITIPIPDDFHHHFRDGSCIKSILEHVTRRFSRCIVMPNLKPPVTTTQQALNYRQRIMDSLPKSDIDFTPLMTLYLTDKLHPDEIRKAHAAEHIYAVKYYPAGATTNSDFGVTDVKNTYPALRAMEECGMMLCIHSEVATPGVDIFDREKVFIKEIMEPIIRDFPKLKIVMEHISTKEAVEFVTKSTHQFLCASITAHHLLYNRNALLVGGIKPHFYCLPILKREIHRQALLAAAISGSPKFFAGTDSAPHSTKSKESCCGCAGIYTAHAAVELYAEAFDSVGKIEMLEEFLSKYGADHYGLERNKKHITLVKKSWTVPKTYGFADETVTPLRAGESVNWSIVEQ